jgi:hypothetical protein
MELSLCGNGQTACIGLGNEVVAEMPEFHHKSHIS